MNLLSRDLKIAHQWATAALESALKDLDLDIEPTQAYLIVALREMDVSPSQKLLSEYANIDKMTVHGIIKRLEARGILTRGRARKIPNSFGRETPIELTALGRLIAVQATAALIQVDALMREKMGVFADGFDDGLSELVDVIRGRTQVE